MSDPAVQAVKILFVDDEESFLELMQRLGQDWSQGVWEIHLAKDASQALALLQDHEIHLVVVDLVMPVVDGVQFLGLLSRKYPNLKKVVLTGHTEEQYRTAALSNGAELFLEKPRSAEDVLGILATLNELARWQPEQGFRGVLRRVGLPEVLQLECLSHNSLLLEVISGHHQGEIFIQDGAILHAQAGERQGEEAFNHLLGLGGGEFKLKPFVAPSRRTITAPWEFLLMEAARMRDEMLHAESLAGETPGVSTIAGEPSAAPAATGEEPPWEAMPEVPVAPLADAVAPALVTVPAPKAAPAAPLLPSRPATVPRLAAPRDSLLPIKTDELLICTAQGEVLYEWQCADLEGRLGLLEFLSQRSRQIGTNLPLGRFDRLEVLGDKNRLVVQLQTGLGILVRTSQSALTLKR